MTRKHISRNYSAHRKSVVRPMNEFCGVEIISYEHDDTMMYSRYSHSYDYTSTNNAKEVEWHSWSSLESANGTTRFEVDCTYVVPEYGEYRFDALYENKTEIDNIGFLQIFDENNNKIYDEQVKFDGEKHHLKRRSEFINLNEGQYLVRWRVPVNCYFHGSIIRHLKYFTGDSQDTAGTNLMLTDCTVSITKDVKASELSMTVGYDNAFECDLSSSGFFMEYYDEVNAYARDEDGELKQIFGGYLSSILPNTDMTTLTITAADRLTAGNKKYIMEAMFLLGGTELPSEWASDMHHDYDTYGEALKHCCELFEETLQNNINENYLVAGEKHDECLTGTFGSKGTVKNIATSNMTCTTSENFITLRNNPTGENYQTTYIYDIKDYNINPVDITDFPNFYLTYGMGDPVTEVSKTETVSNGSDVGATASNSEIISVTMMPSCGCCGGKMAYKKYNRSFKNYCPNCGRHGSLRANPKGVYEGEITCGDGRAPWSDGCDSDFCGVCGGDKAGNGKCNRVKLTPANEEDIEFTTSGSSTTTTTSKETFGYDTAKPLQAYIVIHFSTDKDPENIIPLALDFTQTSVHENSFEGINPTLLNNVVKQGMVNVVDYMKALTNGFYFNDEEVRYRIHKISLRATKTTENYYEASDSNTDGSSCKMDLYGFGFTNGTLINPKDLSSCGKTILSTMSELVSDSGYIVEMEYAKHRKDDIINFKVDNQTEPVFVAMEGNDSNILSFGSISYTPVANLFNTSALVFKENKENAETQYAYVESKFADSVLKYQQQSTLTSTSDALEYAEAYYKCRKNDKYVPNADFTYSITVPFIQDIAINDLVKVISDERKLNTIKKVSSVKFIYKNSQTPKLRTELGLGELAPDLLLKKQLRELREAAKEESTLFSSSATIVKDPDVFKWER